MCYENMQVEFEFGSCQRFFSAELCPVDFEKIPIVYSFRSLSVIYMHIDNFQLKFLNRCVTRICRSFEILF